MTSQVTNGREKRRKEERNKYYKKGGIGSLQWGFVDLRARQKSRKKVKTRIFNSGMFIWLHQRIFNCGKTWIKSLVIGGFV
jgi:hypothetical protein